jgi:glycine C-acetyltransferase
VLDLLEGSSDRMERLVKNTKMCRQRIQQLGFDVIEGETPIIPLMIYDERKAVETASMLLEEGIYVIGFAYPVVPKGKARIRMQISAAHTDEDIDRLIEALEKVGRRQGLIT